MKPSWSRATADQKKGPEGDGVLKSSVKAAATPKRNVTGDGRGARRKPICLCRQIVKANRTRRS